MGAVNYQIVENICHFLTEQTGSVNGVWSGKMSAKEQRKLMGTFLGKGMIVINGQEGKVYHMVKTYNGYCVTGINALLSEAQRLLAGS